MKFKKTLINKIKNSPFYPGCYIFKNNDNKVVYIGKAVNIRHRVSSYFNNFKRLDPKIQVMVEQISDVDFVTTDSELEALILETNLIKKYKPRYNRLMKDDKNYAWLMITKGDDFPRIELIREQKIKNSDYFGPYVNLVVIKRALKRLRMIFPYRTCKRSIYFYSNKNNEYNFYSSNTKPCLYYYLSLCNAPCANVISKQRYRKNISNIKRFFRSKKYKIIEDLKKQMYESASQKNYEKAKIIRDKLQDLSIIAERLKIEKDMDEITWEKTKKESNRKALKNLIKRLKIPDLNYIKNFKIECYDISNISGKSATGSMIVFLNGKPLKSFYRKFKIKTKDEPDDFSMLREVFKRRFKLKKKSIDKSFSKLPDLIIVDGGKGQLSSSIKILTNYHLNIPIIGLAKKEENIFKLFNKKFIKIKLTKGSFESFLIQRIRDEAHRFALKYHRILRSKKQIKSILDDIPGVGDIVRKRLIKAFGSAQNIKKAKNEELLSVVKNKRTVENIKKLI